MQDLEQARTLRLAHDDLGDVVRLGIADDIVGDAPVAAGQRDGLAAERFREPQRVGDAVAFLFGKLKAAPAFDVKRNPRPMEPVGEALGVAHQTGSGPLLADAHEDPFGGRPRALDGVGLHLRQQLIVDAIGGAAQRQLA